LLLERPGVSDPAFNRQCFIIGYKLRFLHSVQVKLSYVQVGLVIGVVRRVALLNEKTSSKVPLSDLIMSACIDHDGIRPHNAKVFFCNSVQLIG